MIRVISYFSKRIKNCFYFSLSFKGLTHAYLMKTSMIHNKYLTFLFFEDNDPISAKTFPLLNFLITGLFNSSASCSFTLIPDPVFLSKTLDHIY